MPNGTLRETEPRVNSKPPIASYDSGYEHSLERMIDVQAAVNEPNQILDKLRYSSGGNAA
jgi:hypothetical protein